LATSPLAPPRVPDVHELDGEQSTSKRKALTHYASQLPLLIQTFPEWWKSATLFDKEWFWRLPPTNPKSSPLSLLPGFEQKDKMGDTHVEGTFLSVIVRTQGLRRNLLPEALGSLAAQTNRDFELLVVAHDVSEPDLTYVTDQISVLPSWLRDHTHLL